MNRRSLKPGSTPRGVKIALISAALVLFATGLYFGIQLAKPPPPPDFAALGATPAAGSGSEGYGDATVAELSGGARKRPDARPEAAVPGTPTVDPGGPRIALVIDDLGRSLEDLNVLARLGIPITYAVLPFESHTSEVVAALEQRGEEFLCHIPMEAKGGNNPGPGALLSSMSRDQLQAATARALAAVPGAVGVNNHMGSSIASDPQAIEAVMKVVAKSNLYFLDSRTSADTLGYSLARHLGIPAGERQVFLDTHRDPAFIRAQFEALLTTARARGGATAIAPPSPETLDLLAAAIPAAKAEGFLFVQASALLEG